jgi:carbonic anhydrase/acetyltransferase-like protein (isoleucine patch superfamily)
MVSLDSFKRLAHRLSAASGPAPNGAGAPGSPQPRSVAPPMAELTRDLNDGASCPADVLSVLQAHVDDRRQRTDAAAGPASPRVSGLTVRRAGLPEWWTAGDNLLLAAQDAKIPEFRLHLNRPPPGGVVVVLGARAVFNHVNLGGQGAMVVLGDRVNCAMGALSCLDASTVLIGEETSATNWAMLDACNGGIIVTGADGMWAHGVSLMTDDTHAIRDVATGRRLNVRGGRILIDRHVWLGENARVMGGARIDQDSVVGAGAMVKNIDIPAHSICVGVPARVVRSGVTWSREDAP